MNILIPVFLHIYFFQAQHLPAKQATGMYHLSSSIQWHPQIIAIHVSIEEYCTITVKHQIKDPLKADYPCTPERFFASD